MNFWIVLSLVANEASLQQSAFQLDPPARQALFDEFAKPVWATLGNVIPGHGMGSFILGDAWWGTGLLVSGILVDGFAAVGVGSFFLGVVGIMAAMDGPAREATGEYLRFGTQALTVAAVGEVVLVALGIGRGLAYSLSYNAALSTALDLNRP